MALGMLTVFQCTTLAGWAQVMYRVMDSGAELAVPYFVALVFFGSYFVVNLFLAVLKSKFGRAQSLFRAKLAGTGDASRRLDSETIARDEDDRETRDERGASRDEDDDASSRESRDAARIASGDEDDGPAKAETKAKAEKRKNAPPRARR